MSRLNPNVRVIPREEAIQPSTALARLRNLDIIIDCTDRPMTRYLLNDAAVRLSKPLVSGAAISSAGQWAVYGGSAKGQKRACYRCLWPALLPGAAGRCEDVGVWGVVTGMVGTGMASEVIKLLLGNEGEPGSHRHRIRRTHEQTPTRCYTCFTSEASLSCGLSR